MELIQHYNARLRPNESGVRENALRANIEVDNCVVRADDGVMWEEVGIDPGLPFEEKVKLYHMQVLD